MFTDKNLSADVKHYQYNQRVVEYTDRVYKKEYFENYSRYIITPKNIARYENVVNCKH